MAIEALIQQMLVLTEDTTSPAQAANSSLRYTAYNKNHKLTGTSTPKVDLSPVDISKTLAAADEDIDLTAVPWAGDTSLNKDMSTGKLLALLLNANIANDSGGVIVRPHPTTNAYNLFGSSSDRVTLLPGQSICLGIEGIAANAQTVGASAKVIRYSGTIGDIITGIAIFGTP